MTGTDCPHGFPSKASCVECMYEGPVGPATPAETQRLTVTRWITASFAGRCSRNLAHPIEVGDRVGYADGTGWICQDCGA